MFISYSNDYFWTRKFKELKSNISYIMYYMYVYNLCCHVNQITLMCFFFVIIPRILNIYLDIKLFLFLVVFFCK